MKDAYYFSHDGNARNDEKLLAVRMKYKWEGYGLFWAIVEKLRESTNYALSRDYNLIAFDLRTDASLIKALIEDFGLFVFTEDGKYFYSERLRNSMEFKEAKSEKARESINKRWEKHRNNTNAIRTYNDGNTIKGKESIGKEGKEKKGKDNKENEKEILPPLSSSVEIPLNFIDLPPIYEGLNPNFSEYVMNCIDQKIPISLFDEWAKMNDCYYGMVLKHPTFIKKVKYLNLPEEKVLELVKDWLKTNTMKASVQWVNIADMLQHCLNYIKLKATDNGKSNKINPRNYQSDQKRREPANDFGEL